MRHNPSRMHILESSLYPCDDSEFAFHVIGNGLAGEE